MEVLKPYQLLLERISRKYIEGQAQAIRSINIAIVETNWQIGKYIFPICQILSDKLSWSHYCELIKISDDLERSFYLQQNMCDKRKILVSSSNPAFALATKQGVIREYFLKQKTRLHHRHILFERGSSRDCVAKIDDIFKNFKRIE